MLFLVWSGAEVGIPNGNNLKKTPSSAGLAELAVDDYAELHHLGDASKREETEKESFADRR